MKAGTRVLVTVADGGTLPAVVVAAEGGLVRVRISSRGGPAGEPYAVTLPASAVVPDPDWEVRDAA